MDDQVGVNPMIASALSRGEDATGLCTVREVADFLITTAKERDDGEGKIGCALPLCCEMSYMAGDERINVEVRVIGVMGEVERKIGEILENSESEVFQRAVEAGRRVNVMGYRKEDFEG